MAAHCRCNINELRMLILGLTLVSTIVLLQMHGNHWILAFGDLRLVPHMLPMIFLRVPSPPGNMLFGANGDTRRPHYIEGALTNATWGHGWVTKRLRAGKISVFCCDLYRFRELNSVELRCLPRRRGITISLVRVGPARWRQNASKMTRNHGLIDSG